MADANRRRRRESVAIAYVHPVDGVGADFHVSMVKLMHFDSSGPRRCALHLHLASGANITNARNEIVRQFLKFNPPIDYLWMVDADMSFEPTIVEQLVAAADAKERPIVGGLCFALDRGEGSQQEIVPTMYSFSPDTEVPTLVRYHTYPKNKLCLVAATGAACMLIHRSVLEEIEVLHQPSAPWNWYQEAIFAGEPIGEDVFFCLRAAQAGYPIFVDTSIKTGHTKPFVLNEELYERQFATAPSAGTSEVPTIVVIPVKNRLDLTRQILEQLHTQGGYDEILVFDNGSTDGTVEYLASQEIASSYDAAGANIYNIWNEGVKEAQRISGGRPVNVAILNNDLDLGPDWLGRMADGLRGGSESLLAACGNYDGRMGVEPVETVTGTFKNDGFAGFAFMVKGEAMGTVVPYFDEGYTWYFGDDDFVHSVEAAGAHVGLVLGAHFVHIGGGSQTSSNGTNNRLGTKALQDSVAGDSMHYLSKWPEMAVKV